MKYSLQSIFALLIFIGFATTPGVALAQSAEDAQIELLQELVVSLQIKLDLLLAQRAANYPVTEAVLFDTDSFLDGIQADVLARYQVTDLTITNRAPRAHERYLDRMEELVPDEYEPYVAEFVVFRSDNDNIDAFVETSVPYTAQWRYGVSAEMLNEPADEPSNSELIVHEFAHIFSMHEAFQAPRPATCHDFFVGKGCIASDTMYGKFMTAFWNDAFLDRAVTTRTARDQSLATEQFYRQYPDQFVNAYAATNPAEDFAESFTYFVLYDDESFGRIADEKIEFFNRFSVTREMKEEILANW